MKAATAIVILLCAAPALADEPAKKRVAMPVEPEGVADAESSVSIGEHVRNIRAIGAIAGGMRFESLRQTPGETAEARHPTVAVSRLGIAGEVGEHISFVSEFEASLGGGLGYGASVWEGQAALAVRSQYLKYARDRWAVAAGRIVDDATFDFVSAHVADLLLTDVYTRDPLLFSGADRGTGIYGSVQITDELSTGLAFHSTNPTGLTGTLLIGGELQPFDRPFYLAAAQVGRSQTSLPDQNLHIYFATPSVQWKDDVFEAKAAVQMYTLDTQMSLSDDDAIRGYNLRANLMAKLVGGKLRPFANLSRNENEMLDSIDATMRVQQTYRAYTGSVGIDYDYMGKNGVGAQYAVIDLAEPDGDAMQRVREHYINVATTYYIEESLSLGLRAAFFVREVGGEEMATGHRSVFLTARLVL
jgi:hypothetical protein